MTDTKKQWLLRVCGGGGLGVLALLGYGLFFGAFAPHEGLRFLFYTGHLPQWLGNTICFVTWFAFGAECAIATLPFAEEGKALLKRSLLHYAIMALTILAWALANAFELGALPWLLVPFTLLYALIWLGRWVGWYSEAAAIREKLGLSPAPSPLKWKETLPHLAFAGLLCFVLPLGLRAVDAPDFPVLTGILLPYLLLPVVGFFSALSLGKRQGFCPLYPAACALFYVPVAFLLMNSSALFHCAMVGVPALVGNLIGAGIRTRKRKKAGE